MNIFYLLLAFFSWQAAASDLNTPLGRWKTIDDETKKPKSIVEITEVNGMLEGKIVQLLREPQEDPNPLCLKCEGELKDKPVLGMRIITGMKRVGERNKWDGGKILDPKNGKVYGCLLSTDDDGNNLVVRGFIGGFTLLGRSQIWERQKTVPVDKK